MGQTHKATQPKGLLEDMGPFDPADGTHGLHIYFHGKQLCKNNKLSFFYFIYSSCYLINQCWKCKMLNLYEHIM